MDKDYSYLIGELVEYTLIGGRPPVSTTSLGYIKSIDCNTELRTAAYFEVHWLTELPLNGYTIFNVLELGKYGIVLQRDPDFRVDSKNEIKLQQLI